MQGIELSPKGVFDNKPTRPALWSKLLMLACQILGEIRYPQLNHFGRLNIIFNLKSTLTENLYNKGFMPFLVR